MIGILDLDAWALGRIPNLDLPDVPTRPTSKEAPPYAQGYLDERRALKPSGGEYVAMLLGLPKGRHLTWNNAGNDPGLSPGMQLAVAARRTLLTTPVEVNVRAVQTQSLQSRIRQSPR